MSGAPFVLTEETPTDRNRLLLIDIASTNHLECENNAISVLALNNSNYKNFDKKMMSHSSLFRTIKVAQTLASSVSNFPELSLQST